MANLFQWLRWVHIAAGSIALLLFWIPAIARKGSRTHIAPDGSMSHACPWWW